MVTVKLGEHIIRALLRRSRSGHPPSSLDVIQIRPIEEFEMLKGRSFTEPCPPTPQLGSDLGGGWKPPVEPAARTQLLRKAGASAGGSASRAPRAASVSLPYTLTRALDNRTPHSCFATWNGVSQPCCPLLLGYSE